MSKEKFVDFDCFLAEREGREITVRVFGRDCRVPAELPWHYVLKVDAMLHGGAGIPGADNFALLKQMFRPEDFAFITGHPEFRASYVWELIARIWLRAGEEEKAEAPAFKTEDEVRIAETRESGAKKDMSARRRCSRSSRLTSNGNTMSTC